MNSIIKNLEAEYTFFSTFDLDKNNDNKIDEDTLLGKMISRDIIRTDVPSYLLREELTFCPQKGPISKIQYYGAFNGHISSNWNEDNYTSTSYNFNVLLPNPLSLPLFFSFLAESTGIRMVPGQGLNPCHSNDPGHCSDNTGSLTCVP